MNFVETKFQQYLARNYFKVEESGEIWRLRNRRRGKYKHLVWKLRASPCRAESDCGEYLGVALNLLGRTRYIQAHRAVWIGLFGDIPDGLMVNHKDGDKHNNHPDNLELVTPSENAIHARDVLEVGPWRTPWKNEERSE